MRRRGLAGGIQVARVLGESGAQPGTGPGPHLGPAWSRLEERLRPRRPGLQSLGKSPAAVGALRASCCSSRGGVTTGTREWD